MFCAVGLPMILMATQTADEFRIDDVSKFLFKAKKGAHYHEFTNPIEEYIMENSAREPEILRRLHEVQCAEI